MKKPNISPAAPVAALSDDLLGEVLLRLPDLPSLASAALVKKRWRRVATDSTVASRFRPFRRPQLVGVILSDRGDMPFPGRCPKLRFVPSHSPDPRLVATAGAGDFSFDDLPNDYDEETGGVRHHDDNWRLRCCDGGLLLSRGSNSRELAVYDPFARTAVFFRPPDAHRSWCHTVTYAIVVDETDASFRVIAVLFLKDATTAAVFSSLTRDWAPISGAGALFDRCSEFDGVRAGRFVYWRSDSKKWWDDEEEILVLDTGTMQWSVITAPFAVGKSYCLADVVELGGMCLVSSKEQLLQIWVRESDDEEEEWVIKKVPLLKEFGLLKDIRREEWMKRVRPLAMRGDFVLEFWSISKPKSYVLLLNLRTIE